MRTTLDIDEDLLIAVKEIAKRESRSAGDVTSELLRRALACEGSAGVAGNEVKEVDAVYGFRPFPRRGGIVTNQLIDQLRDESGD